jgi:hypothetical protein
MPQNVQPMNLPLRVLETHKRLPSGALGEGTLQLPALAAALRSSTGGAAH